MCTSNNSTIHPKTSTQKWYNELPINTHEENPLPEICRFYGIIIRMYAEAGVQHHSPHFHSYYQNDSVVYDIENMEIIAGSLPRKQQRLLEAWTELHQGELMENWNRLQSGQLPYKIVPLR